MKVYVVVPDLHVPFHDPIYLRIVNKVISKIRPTGIVQLGDALDFWQVSKYDKNPENKDDIFDNIEDYKKILLNWERLLPAGSEIHQLEGNHSHRMTRYIWAQAKEIHKAVKPLKDLLGLSEITSRGKVKATFHPYTKWDSCQLGNTILHHGFYFNQHVAWQNLLKYGVNFICGHTHRFQFVTNGKLFSVTIGHGSDEKLTAHSPTPTGWQQAFGILRIIDGRGYFEPVLVTRGRCIINGEVIDAK